MHSLARRALRSEAGLAVPVAMLTMMVVGTLSAVLLATAMQANQTGVRDRNDKAALEVANAGLQLAVSRLSAQAPGSIKGTDCFTTVDAGVPSPTTGCPPQQESYGNGSFKYYVSPDLQQTPNTCTGYWVKSPNDGIDVEQRCITALGTLNGVTRRVQERVAALTFTFPVSGVLSMTNMKWDTVNASAVQFNGVSCASTSTCFGAGASGTIYATGNGGAIWYPESSATNNQLNEISCPTTTTCFSVGNTGTIMASTDGSSWSTQTSPTTQNLFGVSCTSTTSCFAVGASGAIATTADGSTWSSQTSPTTNQLNAVSCPSASVCFAAGNSGTIVATTNGGASWTKQISHTTQNLFGISCPSTTSCFAVGASGVVDATTDGGTNWATQTSGTTNQLNQVSCPSTTACFAVGASGTILATTNGGASWSKQTSGTSQSLYGVSCPSTSTCFAFGASGVVTSTTTGGSSWSAKTLNASATMSGNFEANGAITITNATDNLANSTWSYAPGGSFSSSAPCTTAINCSYGQASTAFATPSGAGASEYQASATNNNNAALSGWLTTKGGSAYTASTRTLNATGVYTAGNPTPSVSNPILMPSGVYNFCNMTVQNSYIQIAPGAQVVIYIDSSQNSDGCSGTGALTMNSTEFYNAGTDPGSLQIRIWGDPTKSWTPGSAPTSPVAKINDDWNPGLTYADIYAPYDYIQTTGAGLQWGGGIVGGNFESNDNDIVESVQTNPTGAFYPTAWHECSTNATSSSDPGSGCY